MFRDEHINSYTIFESAQLFEGFGTLERARFPGDESKQGRAAEGVDALVSQKDRASIPVA